MNIDYGHSPYHSFAGQTLHWLPMDTRELYEKNLKDNFIELEKYGWVNSSFTYNFNKSGFRCQEFNTSLSIVFLGASVTTGIGLPEECIWTTIVAKKLNLTPYNLGVGGAANDTSFRLAYYWLDKLKPHVVVNLQTFNHRTEIFTIKKFENNHELGEFEHCWTLSEINGNLNKLKNNLAIAKLCENLKIHYVSLEATDMEPYKDLARDLYHPGKITNSDFADYVLSKI